MHKFDQELNFTEAGDHLLQADISDNWTHRGNLNGGLLLGLVGKAASFYSDKSGSMQITANYLDRTLPGKVEILVEELSASRNFDRFEVCLVQDGKKVLRTFCTLSQKTGETEDLSGSADYKPSALETDCIEMTRPGVTIMYENMSVKVDPATSGWMKDELTKPGAVNGWIRFREPRMFDLYSVPLAVDCFPPSIFSALGASAWVPTLELSAFITRSPDVDALWSSFRTNFYTDGIIVEDGIVTDPDGKIVAVSRQTAVYRKA